jgi:hypothetical protein
MLEESSKATIDALSLEELEYEVQQGRYSKFQNENFAYVKARLARLRRETQDADITKTHNLADDANAIADKSVTTGFLSYRMTVISVVVALIGIVLFMWFSK